MDVCWEDRSWVRQSLPKTQKQPGAQPKVSDSEGDRVIRLRTFCTPYANEGSIRGESACTILLDPIPFLTVYPNLQAMQETTGKRVPTDSSLIAIFEIFDIASFDTTDARRGFNQNLVDDVL
jgi:hypothetical protein